MKCYEEIYTSADSLLDNVSGNLGVVARTRGFPQELNREFSGQRGYTLLSGLPLDRPDAHPPRLVLKAQGNDSFLTATQVVFGGCDHTGRTTPLAHHVAVPLVEMRGCDGTPANILNGVGKLFSRSWSSDPSWIDPPRCIKPQAEISPNLSLFQWSRFIEPGELVAFVSAIIGSLVEFPVSQRSLVLLVSPEQVTDPTRLIAELLSLLPRVIQQEIVACTHVVEIADFVRGCSLALTYRNSDFHAQSIQRHDPRRPVIIDPASKDSYQSVAAEKYGNLFSEVVNRGGVSAGRQIATDWDELQFHSKDVEVFCKYVATQQLVSDLYSVANVEAVGTAFGKLTGLTIAAQSRLSQSCVAVSSRLVGSNAEPNASSVLAKMATSQAWPREARIAAAKTLCGNLEIGLPLIFESARGAPNADLLKIIAEAIPADSKSLEGVIALARRTGGEPLVAVAALLLPLAKVEPATIIRWASALRPRDNAVDNSLANLLITGLSEILVSETTVQSARRWMSDSGMLLPSGDCERSWGVLASVMSRLSPNTWNALANRMVMAASELDQADAARLVLQKLEKLGPGRLSGLVPKWDKELSGPHRTAILEEITRLRNSNSTKARSVEVSATSGSVGSPQLRAVESWPDSQRERRGPTARLIHQPMRIARRLAPRVGMFVLAGILAELSVAIIVLLGLRSQHGFNLAIVAVAGTVPILAIVLSIVLYRFFDRRPDSSPFINLGLQWVAFGFVVASLAVLQIELVPQVREYLSPKQSQSK